MFYIVLNGLLVFCYASSSHGEHACIHDKVRILICVASILYKYLKWAWLSSGRTLEGLWTARANACTDTRFRDNNILYRFKDLDFLVYVDS